MIPKSRITTHPGEILLEEFLKPLGLSQSELARRVGVKPGVINEICNRRRSVSPRMAVLLAKVFGVSPEFWSGLQADYDLSRELQSREGAKAASRVEPMLA